MKKTLFFFLILSMLIMPVFALDLEPPEVPQESQKYMPQDTKDFGKGMEVFISEMLEQFYPNLIEATGTCMSIIAISVLISALLSFSVSTSVIVEISGASAISILLFQGNNAMIQLGSAVVTEMVEYEKLLLPVLAAAIAAQGGVTVASALYAGTALFVSLLSRLILRFFLPLLNLFLVVAIANCAFGDTILAKTKDMMKGFISWSLRTLLTVFTTYMAITGVVSGSTDAVALKAAKVTIGSLVPVVGGILSEASEAVLVSASLIKNAVGVYGIFAILAIYVSPFVKIGAQYLVMKMTALFCSVYSSKKFSGLLDDFSTAMGLILALTGSVCIMLLISSICFLKGVGQ